MHKMNTHFNMYNALNLNGLSEKINHIYMITINKATFVIGQWSSRIKQVLKPTRLMNYINNTTTLDFNTRSRQS
jgi:hypothetical protein